MKFWKRWQSRLKAVKEEVLPPNEPAFPMARPNQEAKILGSAAKHDAEADGMKLSASYILLALLRGEYEDCQAVFQEQGVDTEALQEYVSDRITEIANIHHDADEQTLAASNAKRTNIFGCAEQEARSMGLKTVTPLHILFGLVTEEHAWSRPVLAHHGINTQVVRARLRKVYGHVLVQPSQAPEDTASLLHVVQPSETESIDLLRPVPEEI